MGLMGQDPEGGWGGATLQHERNGSQDLGAHVEHVSHMSHMSQGVEPQVEQVSHMSQGSEAPEPTPGRGRWAT